MCLGAMDGKHLSLYSPENSGSRYFNYKKFFSIVLLGLVDAQYRFIYVDVGCQVRISDGGVFGNSEIREGLEQCTLNIPAPTPLTAGGEPTPFVIAVDDAFPLAENTIKPYGGTHDPGSRERIFNYRCSRARRTSENVFGILTAVFGVLRKPMRLRPKKARRVALTCCYLHNFLRKSGTSRRRYTPPGTLDAEDNSGHVVKGLWRNDAGNATSMIPFLKTSKRATNKYKAKRNRFADYFMNEGKIAWQNEYA